MSRHEHTKRCYWDFHEARWVCRTAVAPEQPVTEFPAVVLSTDQPVPAAATSAAATT